MEAGKEEFLKEFGEDYGYPNAPKSIDQIRATDFKRLDQNGMVYLDHAGATLYSELQMEEVLKDLTSTVYGNPHSQSDSSSATAEIIRKARQQTLEYCNASPKDYRCIFTSGATAALKLIGEAFPWSSSSTFMYTMENHNSVLGIREYALNQGAASVAVDIQDPPYGVSGSNISSVTISQRPVQRRKAPSCLGSELADETYNLFAFPSESNFSGLRFSLDLVNLVKDDSARFLAGSSFSKGRWMVLIDAAKGCATQPPDLSKYPADFVVISFYKLFGYPTGLGALIVQNDAAKLLKKTYFSGGTVAASFADADFVKRRDSIEELFEDGTASFLSIASVRHGFNVIGYLTTPAICRHIACLTNYVKKALLSLRHWNGAPACKLYGDDSSKVLCSSSGSIVSFNLKRPDDSWVGYREVEKLASLSGIQLRTGCFCNPGACAKYLGLSHQVLLSNIEAGHICWDDNDIMQGKPTGAVRISFGYMSTYEDAKRFIDFITTSFLSRSNECVIEDLVRRELTPLPTEGIETKPAGYSLKSITVYPIKSCGGFNVERWPLSTTGLLYDREWILTSVTGEVLTQKKVPEMCLINTSIDLSQGVMHVESPRCMSKLRINLAADMATDRREEIDLYAQRYEVAHHQADVNAWFSKAVGRPCNLLRLASSKYFSCLNKSTSKDICRDVISKLNFANGAQFLLIMEESVADLNSRLLLRNAQNNTLGSAELVEPMRFRPNLVASGGKPYAEDGWRSIKIGSTCFASVGGCNRCQMINYVRQRGKVLRSNEPLATLASYRRIKGKILFGILLRQEMADKTGQQRDLWLQVGQEVQPYLE